MDNRRYDLILRGGRVICPASGIDGIRDVAVPATGASPRSSRGTILPSAAATEIVDVLGKLVLPGMIDTHAHVYQYVTGRFGLNPDMVGVRSGVTTVVDQGGPSCMTLPGFRHFIAERSADPGARLPLGLPRRRPRRALLPQPLQPGGRRQSTPP